MNYKKWLIIALSSSALLYIFMVVAYVLVDAELVFNKTITNQKYGYTQYYSKHQYDKLKEKNYTLIFGTSRSHKLSSDELNIDLLNFHSIYGEPEGILNFLSQLDRNQIENIDNIYYLVSIRAMTDDNYKVDYKSNTFIDKLDHILPLSNQSIKNTIRDLRYYFDKKSIYYYIDNDGSLFVTDKNKSSTLKKRTSQRSSVESIKKTQSIDALIKINKFCIENDIKITYYTPTYSDRIDINIETIDLIWTQLLNGGLEGFYEAYYIDGISDGKIGDRYLYFTDETHLNYTAMNNAFKNIVINKDSDRFISNKQQLKNYIEKVKKTIKND